MRELTISHEDHRDESGGKTRVLHVVGCGFEDFKSTPIRLEFSAAAGRLTSLSDGLVLLVLFFAMEHADVLRVRGTLSRSFLRNLRQFQEAWHCLMPGVYRVVHIQPDRLVDPMPRMWWRNRAISAFSGGVDASFAAMRHGPHSRERWKYDVDSVLMIHGMDIRYEHVDAFRGLVTRVDPFLKARGLKRIEVRTDIRTHPKEFQSWTFSHAAQMIGIMHQLSPSFAFGILGSSEPYNRMVVPWGSMPATDHLLSGLMQIVHDGAGYSRTQKVEYVASDAIARQTVKVCWAGPDGAVNCGRCEKCVRTRLNFLAAGRGDPPCFDEPFSIEMMSVLSKVDGIPLNELSTIVEFARQRGATGDWFRALDELVTRRTAEVASRQTLQTR
jgi:hypothetical protein